LVRDLVRPIKKDIGRREGPIDYHQRKLREGAARDAKRGRPNSPKAKRKEPGELEGFPTSKIVGACRGQADRNYRQRRGENCDEALGARRRRTCSVGRRKVIGIMRFRLVNRRGERNSSKGEKRPNSVHLG